MSRLCQGQSTDEGKGQNAVQSLKSRSISYLGYSSSLWLGQSQKQVKSQCKDQDTCLYEKAIKGQV